MLSINGVVTKSWSDLVLFIQNNPNTDINVIVDRDDKIIEYTAKVLDKNGHGFLGISKKSINLILLLSLMVSMILLKKLSTVLLTIHF